MIDKNGIERCDFAHAHEDIVRTVMDRMPDEETLYDLAELFKVLGTPHGSRFSVFSLRLRCASATSPSF